MGLKVLKLLKWTVVLLVLALAGLLGIRAWDSQRGAPLAVWHLYSAKDLRVIPSGHCRGFGCPW